MFSLNINTDRAVIFSNKLEKMSNTALPSAIRETLSKTALRVKQKTMPGQAKKTFTQRQQNFFKANSSVIFAKGKDINLMQSEVGFVENKLKGSRNYAVKDLEQQEHGGKIYGRRFMPLDAARVGKSRKKRVKLRDRIEKIALEKIIRAGGATALTYKGRRMNLSKKQRWIRAAFVAKKLNGNNAFVLGNIRLGRRTLSRIYQISSSIRSQKLEIKRTPVYSYDRRGIRPVKSTGFMRRASYEAAMRMELDYITQARKQIDRLMNGK